MEKAYKGAIYVRLSREDKDKEESNSITNQKALIYEYLKKKPEIQVVSEWADDGYSGVSFKRPGFQKMMAEIQAGKVNCVIVKDLSRFARNYIDAGLLIENDFPRMGVRFIAVTDQYDSAETENDGIQSGILIPFKNMMNDFYCGDISRKIRGSLDAKRKHGDYAGSFAPYGYRKKIQNKNQLSIDPETEKYIRQIFRWKLMGKSCKWIADCFNEEKVPSPYEYFRSRGIRINGNLRNAENALWHGATVLSILKNPVYIGTLVQGKTMIFSYKLKIPVKKKQEDWILTENAHEPIIPLVWFATIQKQLKNNIRVPARQSEAYLFSGLLLCGNCGKTMTRTQVKKKKKTYVYYICSAAKAKENCKGRRMGEEYLVNAACQTVKTQLQILGLYDSVKDMGSSSRDFLIYQNILSYGMALLFFETITVYQNQRIGIFLSYYDIFI